MFHQTPNGRELWIGPVNKNLANNYVHKMALGHRFIYEGRINGRATKDQVELKKLEVRIVAQIYDLKAA